LHVWTAELPHGLAKGFAKIKPCKAEEQEWNLRATEKLKIIHDIRFLLD